MKKVLYVSPNGYLGGAERFVLTAAKFHLALGAYKPIILFYSHGEAVDEARSAGIECHILSRRVRLRNPINLFLSVLEIRRIFTHIKPEVLHFTMPYSQITGSLAALGLPVKKVWFQHGPVGGLLDKIASLFPTDLLLFNSQDLLERHSSSCWKKNIAAEEVLPLGITGDGKERMIYGEPSVRVSAAGRICSWKGFHLLLLAIVEVEKEFPQLSYALKIAGNAKTSADSIYFDELKSMVKKNGLEKKVMFLSHVSEMASFYADTDLFIHTSITPEPFGLVVAEAMLQGCFVIGSNQGGVTEILINQETGISFDPSSKTAVQDLKNLLGLWLKPKESEVLEARNLARAAQLRIQGKFSVTHMGKRLEEVYDDLTTQR